MDPSSSASSRLAVLARQLTSADELKRNDTLAEETRPAPGGGRGTLTVLDNRTGKKYTVRCGAACAGMCAWRIAELPTRKQTVNNRTPHLTTTCRTTSCAQLEVSEGGTLNAQALKAIKAGGDGVGLRTYDPG